MLVEDLEASDPKSAVVPRFFRHFGQRGNKGKAKGKGEGEGEGEVGGKGEGEDLR